MKPIFDKKAILLYTVLSISFSLTAQDAFIPADKFENEKNNSILELNDQYTINVTGINSALSEVGSTFFMDKYLMYSSRKTGAIGAGKDSNTNNPYNSLYCMSVDKTGNLSKPYFFASVLDAKGNENGLTFSPDQKTVYYTNSKPENTQNYQLYKAVFNEECRCSWIKAEEAGFNSPDYSIENPCVSKDGKKIYFSSNMPGGFGGFDLYVADLDTHGIPVNPKNLGSIINTNKDEKFPYISPENELYFSSNGHEGYGGQDIFVSKMRKSQNSFSTPLNLGKTINTAADEVAFILATKNRGFFTSNRSQGLGLYDIYRFELLKNTNTLKGLVVEKESKIVLPNTKITLLDSEGNEIATQISDDKGAYTFEVTPLENYTILATKKGYADFSTPIMAPIGNSNSNVALEQEKAVVTDTAILIENIYFDFNKAIIKNESTLSLNKIYEVLRANPAMNITINAHTDSRGSDQYNLVLSDKRAVSAKNYLIKKGIDKTRIQSKGYGETKPLSTCGSNCSEVEFDADRRVEFVIIK